MSSHEFKFNYKLMTESTKNRCKKNNLGINLLYKLNKHMGTKHPYLNDAINDAKSRGIISNWQAKKFRNIKDNANEAKHIFDY